MGAKKTINISNHFGPMDFVLYTDNGVILQGKAKFINQVDKKAEKAAEKKLSMVFKYDKSGILSVQRVEAILLEDTPDEDKQVENTYQLDVKTRLSGPQPMSKDQMKEAKSRIDKFEKRDRQIEKTREARNDFETALFGAKEWIYDDENGGIQYFKDEEERASIESVIDTAMTWLEEDGYDATEKQYKDRKSEFETDFKPIKRRKTG